MELVSESRQGGAPICILDLQRHRARDSLALCRCLWKIMFLVLALVVAFPLALAVVVALRWLFASVVVIQQLVLIVVALAVALVVAVALLWLVALVVVLQRLVLVVVV